MRRKLLASMSARLCGGRGRGGRGAADEHGGKCGGRGFGELFLVNGQCTDMYPPPPPVPHMYPHLSPPSLSLSLSLPLPLPLPLPLLIPPSSLSPAAVASDSLSPFLFRSRSLWLVSPLPTPPPPGGAPDERQIPGVAVGTVGEAASVGESWGDGCKRGCGWGSSESLGIIVAPVARKWRSIVSLIHEAVDGGPEEVSSLCALIVTASCDRVASSGTTTCPLEEREKNG